MELVREIDIGGKLALAAQQRAVFLASDGLANQSRFGGSSHDWRISTAAARTALMMFW
jgi:hypothetical protein